MLAARGLAAAGHGLTEIARRLGVSRSSAYNYLSARDCPGCGAPLTSPTADACRECTRHLPSVARAWTREEALEAIRDWTREHGRPPTYRDWTPSRRRPGRWEAESPRWPSAAAVCACYPDSAEPWLSALRDSVGLRPWGRAHSSTGSPIGTQRKRSRTAGGAVARSASIASRPCLKCDQPS